MNTAHAVATVRISTLEGPQLVPVLFVESADGRVGILREALDLSLSMIAAGRSIGAVRASSKTIGRLADVYRFARPAVPLDGKHLDDLIHLYADYRLNGSAGTDGLDPLGLGWDPVRWEVLARELREIAQFSDWCVSRYGRVPLTPSSFVSLRTDTSEFKRILALREAQKKSFLAHLVPRRQAWHEQFPSEPRPPLRAPRPLRKGDGKVVVSEDFVRELIDRERNPVYRMFWIMAAWGSPRGSEQLNMWICDVLPPTWRPRLFPRDTFDGTPLVVLADPRNSTWVGSSSDFRRTRLQYLKHTYGLRPRPDCMNLAMGPLGLKVTRAGWKGMMLTNGNLQISQVYWTDPEMAWEYDRLARDLLEFNRTHKISERHPWLLVNTDVRKPEVLGRPITMSNVNKAWERACRRLGVDPYQGGRHKHVLRDFYVNYIKQKDGLGLSPEVRKLMLHHISESSQNLYGSIDHHALNESIRSAIRNRR